ncbi:hypothetical protein E2C01_045856 [Portunus trituberculatus]|uniref:Uncharacterized protein n=1 Tax=Portunus trituberculatus TaxID=210409 RepID=A0A5B7G493_PORTR|nr:hypothetical protein [Portunus trituberculatus]
MVTSGRNYSATRDEADPWKWCGSGASRWRPRVHLVCFVDSSGLNRAYNVDGSEMMTGVKGSSGDPGWGTQPFVIEKYLKFGFPWQRIGGETPLPCPGPTLRPSRNS